MSKQEAEQRVPAHTLGSLQRYIEQRIAPGAFLTAVLGNDLKRAFGSADEWNRQAMHDIVFYLYNYAPSACWGSYDKVTQWLHPEVTND